MHESVKESLPKQLETPNPLLLRKAKDKKMKKIFSINNKLREQFLERQVGRQDSPTGQRTHCLTVESVVLEFPVR